jgi:hypothetical protein
VDRLDDRIDEFVVVGRFSFRVGDADNDGPGGCFCSRGWLAIGFLYTPDDGEHGLDVGRP